MEKCSEVMKVDETNKVFKLMEDRGGYLTSKEARENGIENKKLQRMAARGFIERAAYGLYVNGNTLPDPFYVAQYRCPKGIFSHETALFLNGLSDRDPLRLMMTIPSGWNSKMLPEDNIVFFYSKPDKMKLGISEVETSSGLKVKVFDSERTLCDCLKNVEKLDRDLVITALKRYVKEKNRDSTKLLEYATELKIRDMVFRYLEVLV
jgi:predicted transcriptional regulator of viral defense system